MRVLFLHAASNGLTSEYKVHLTLAAHASRTMIDPYFIWQSPIKQDVFYADRIISHDFGRDMSIMPKPSRYHRALMIAKKLPQSLLLLLAKTAQIKPDVIYTSQQSVDIRFAEFLSNYFHIPHVIHIHYNVGPWLGNHALKAIKTSSRLIAVSEYTRQTALLQGTSPNSVHTVLNPVPVSQSQHNPTQQTIRAEFNLEEHTPLVVAIGRLDPGKGHLGLFEAFAHVIQQIPQARLLICGTSTSHDNYEQTLRQRVQSLQLSPYVIFAGQRNDIPAIMQSAQVFCLPTEMDPCPLVFLEAMAEGLPVVAYYSGGVPEMVIHTQTGLLSYPGDIPHLAMNIVTLLSDTSYAQRLGDAGKQRVLAEFTPAYAAERWVHVLQEKAK